jgi:transcriptional regulator with XRE-family HTH domain
MPAPVPNEQLRAAREAHGLTQERVADELNRLIYEATGRETGIDANKVSRLERGVIRWPSKVERAALRALFAVTDDADLGLSATRRGFLAVPAAAAVAGSLTGQLAFGRRIGPGDIARLVQRGARLRRLDDLLGGADTFATYRAELDATITLEQNSTYGEKTGAALRSLIAEQAQQAGWAAFDAGWTGKSRSLYRQSLTYAQDAGDEALTGNALAFLAYRTSGTARESVQTATAAAEHAGPHLPAAVRALLLERLGWACAAAGDVAGTERALAAAEEALRHDGGPPPPNWAAWVDATELQIMTGRCFAQLRQPRRAVPALQAAMDQFPDSCARDKALYLTWLSDAHRDAGDVEQSAHVLNRAVDLADGIASVRPRRRIRTVLDTLEPHRTVPAVADVFEHAGV